MATRGRRAGGVREKRPGYWEISAPGPRDPVTGKRKRVYGTPVRGGRRDADRALAALQAKIEAGDVEAAEPDTFAEALEEWWATMRAAGWEDATAIRHRYDLDGYLLPQLGRRHLNRLEPKHLTELYAWMVAAGSAPRSVQHVHNTARAALNHALRNQKVKRNVAEAAVVPKRKWTPRTLPALAELEAVLELARDGGRFDIDGQAVVVAPSDMWWAWMRVAFFTGARPAEVCHLRWRNIDLAGATLRYEKAFGRSSEPGVGWKSKGTKTHSERDSGQRPVALDSATVAVLRSWRGIIDGRLAAAGARFEPGLFVFPGERDVFGRVAITPATPSRRWRHYARPLGIDPEVRLYDAARHHHISWCIAAGFPVPEIAARVGNSPETIYRTYAHLLPGNDRAIADRIDQAAAG